MIADFIKTLIPLAGSGELDSITTIGTNIDEWDINILTKWMQLFDNFASDYIASGQTDSIKPYNMIFTLQSDQYANERLLTLPQVKQLQNTVQSIFNSVLNLRSTLLTFLDQLPYDNPALRCQSALCLGLPAAMLITLVQSQLVGRVDMNKYKVIDPLLRTGPVLLQSSVTVTVTAEDEPNNNSTPANILTRNNIFDDPDSGTYTSTVIGKVVDILLANNKHLCVIYNGSSNLDPEINKLAVRLSRALILCASSYLTWLTSNLSQHFPVGG